MVGRQLWKLKIAIRDNGTLRSLANEENVLYDMLVQHENVDIYLKDGAWTRDIHLPLDNIVEGRKVIVHRNSTWESTVHLDGSRTQDVDKGETIFIYRNGRWNAPFNNANAFKLKVYGSSFTISTAPSSYSYDYHVDCNDDGIIEHFSVNDDYTCTYEIADIYVIAIYGDFPHLGEGRTTHTLDKAKIQTVQQWGSIQWQSMNRSFMFSNITTIEANDVPDLSNVTDIGWMFYGASRFNADLSSWDVSNVTNMQGLFTSTNLDCDLSSWDVSNVTNMLNTFTRVKNFNSDLSNWDVSNVVTMERMFFGGGDEVQLRYF